MQRIDRAYLPLGLTSHGADPERAGRMNPGIVRTRCRIVGFERTEQRHPSIRRLADIETIVGDEKLAMRVDPPKRAAHHVERMDGGLPGVEPRFEQPALDNVEPPGGIGSGVVGRPLAEMASLAAENGCRHLFHFLTADHCRFLPGNSPPDCVPFTPRLARVKRYSVVWR